MEHLSLLLLLLPVCSSQDYSGTVMTYYPLSTDTDGRVVVAVRYKSNSRSCVLEDYWCPPEGCWGLSHVTVKIDAESSGDFCQIESIWTRQGPTNAPMLMRLLPYSWISPTVNGVTNAKGMSLVELRSRSDSGQTNRSPQTTILPIIRVPSNCQRDIRLLAFDPDGDLVKCRFADNSVNPEECSQCTPPAVLSLSPTCSLSFSPTDDSSVGWYAVQLMVEDFPRTNIILSLNNGSQEVRTTNDTVSKVPVQFVFSVEAAAPSCTEGLYLPRFVEPTPEHGAQLNVNVSQTLQIYIKAEANISTISELLFSGPSRISETDSGGQYILSWTPVQTENGQSHPVCFSVQALLNSTKYTSEFRCVIANVGNASKTTANINTTAPPTTTTAPPPVKAVLKSKMSSFTPLSEDDVRTIVIQQFRDELIKRGLPSDMALRLVNVTSTAPSAGSP